MAPMDAVNDSARAERFAEFHVPLPVTVRACVEGDLPQLEWFGKFTPHREIIRDAYERQQRGENLMLVAEVNQFPVGQAWIDLAKKRSESVGVLWAVRVLRPFRRSGIGSRLLRVAERVLRERGYAAAEIGVERHNSAARRLYERLGYWTVGEEREEYDYTTPDGVYTRVPVDQWILRKRLNGEAPDRGNGER